MNGLQSRLAQREAWVNALYETKAFSLIPFDFATQDYLME